MSASDGRLTKGMAWLELLETGRRLVAEGQLRELGPLLPLLLDSIYRDSALALVAGSPESDAGDEAGVAFARATLAPPNDAEAAVGWLLRAQRLADETDQKFHARIARDLGALYLSLGQSRSAEAVLAWTRGRLGTIADESADLLLLEALLRDAAGDAADAARLNRKAVERSAWALTPMSRALALANLASASSASDPRACVSLAQVALGVIEADRLSRRVEAAVRNILGFARIPGGDLTGARHELLLSGALAKSSGHLRVKAFTDFNLCIVSELEGRFVEAGALLDGVRVQARANGFKDLDAWIDIRRCWLALISGTSRDDLRSLVASAEGGALSGPHQQACAVIRALGEIELDEARSLGEFAAHSEAEGNLVDAFALRLQAAARDHSVGRERSARRWALGAAKLGQELGLRAAPNWWSQGCARVMRIYAPEVGNLLHEPTTTMRPRRVQLDAVGRIEIDGEALDIWSEGRSGRRVLRRFFQLLVANPAGLVRDSLCDELWPESEGDRAVRNLYAATDDLRRALRRVPGVRLRTELGLYRIELDASVRVRVQEDHEGAADDPRPAGLRRESGS